MPKHFSAPYDGLSKEDLQSEVDLRGIKDISGTGANAAVLKDDLILALDLDDESSASDPKDQDPAHADLKKVATADGVTAREVPSDLGEYQGSYKMVDGGFPDEVFGLKVLDGDVRHNKTHLAKSPIRFGDYTKEEFRLLFEKI